MSHLDVNDGGPASRGDSRALPQPESTAPRRPAFTWHIKGLLAVASTLVATASGVISLRNDIWPPNKDTPSPTLASSGASSGGASDGATATPPSKTYPAPPGSPTGRLADEWPGGSGYTTVLASVKSEAEARRIQSHASARGLDAGVLYSNNYRSLRPDYWVVFSGTSPNKQDADRRTDRAKRAGYAAYPRFVSGSR